MHVALVGKWLVGCGQIEVIVTMLLKMLLNMCRALARHGFIVYGRMLK